MNLRIFKIKSQRIEGNIYVTYKDGEFHALEVEKPISADQFVFLKNYLPQKVDDVSSCGLSLVELKPRSVQDKIILFNTLYKHYRGTTYVAKKQEKANLATVPVNENLLKAFFTSSAWWATGNYTIGNYIKRINLIKDVATNGVSKVVFPDKWDPDYEKKLPNELLGKYHEHLRSLGLKSKYNPGMGTIWIK